MFCSDDEDDSSDESEDYGLLDMFDICYGCSSKSSSSSKTTTTEKPTQQPVKIMIRKSNLVIVESLRRKKVYNNFHRKK